MKRSLALSLAGLLVIAFFTAGCSNKINGVGPEEIPVQWANAEIQQDTAKQLKMLQKKTNILDPNRGPQNHNKLSAYQLIEWKASDDKYFYQIKFYNPTIEMSTTDQMEVVKTKDGWKRTEFGDLWNFDLLIRGLEPKVLREMRDDGQ